MTKRFCDRCGDELSESRGFVSHGSEESELFETPGGFYAVTVEVFKPHHDYCRACVADIVMNRSLTRPAPENPAKG